LNLNVIPTLLVVLSAQIIAAPSFPEYIYGDSELDPPFSVTRSELRSIDSPEGARAVFRGALSEISDKDKNSPYALDALMTLAEECIRFGAASDPNAVKLDILDSAARYGVELPREPRLGVIAPPDDLDDASIIPPESIYKNVDFLYIDTPFATLRANAGETRSLRDIAVRRVDERPKGALAAARFWGVWGMSGILIASILIEPLRRRKITGFIVAPLCLALIALNFFTTLKPSDGQNAAEQNGVLVKIAENRTAVLSLPSPDGADFVVVDANGAPVPSRYNPVTQMIDAKIKSSGKYYLKISVAYFSDISDRSEEMQLAIRTLASCGLMGGAKEREFLPHRQMTRAEFVSVALRLMDALDETASSDFPDVLSDDWFYSVAASAEKEGLAHGYEDGSFRGNDPMPKIQMVTIAANVLNRMMDYPEPPDTDAALAVYTDADSIAGWSRDAVALATSANITPARADGGFYGDSVMTRGDAAVMLYRLFNKTW
jgi:hypothetical protein